VPPGIDGANITQGVVRIRPGNRVLGEYLAYYLSTPSTQQRMRAQYVGRAMSRINVRDARDLLIDLPPLDEQHEIVKRIKQLFWLADKLTEHIERASRHVDRSTQAVLARAFRGDLIPSTT
jgi:type I restriction enzyme, S subunit